MKEKECNKKCLMCENYDSNKKICKEKIDFSKNDFSVQECKKYIVSDRLTMF